MQTLIENRVNLQERDEEIRFTLLDILENNPDFWDFRDADTKEISHGYHSYPAMMIPQVSRNLIHFIKHHQNNITNIFDPFGGSGTTLVEGIMQKLDAYGTDLNPLARLMMKVKTKPIEPQLLQQEIDIFMVFVRSHFEQYSAGEITINRPAFKNIDYWFKDYVIDHLQIIKNNIYNINNNDVRQFVWLVFSETVRYVSNTRNNEFKLFRIQEEKLPEWNPDVLDVFTKFLNRNVEKNNEFFEAYNRVNTNRTPSVNIYDYNTMDLSAIPDNSFDLLVTSPPYGDSKTTVAYGQFSRLSLQWLDFEDIGEDLGLQNNVNKIDNILLGGKVEKELEAELASETLSTALQAIREQDEKRAKEVLQFYVDLDVALSEIARVMKPNSYQCWVVGNRTVKKVNLKTDQIIAELFRKYNVRHVITFQRNIPNKKMPRENSPTNKAGQKITTMNNEFIVILRKE